MRSRSGRAPCLASSLLRALLGAAFACLLVAAASPGARGEIYQWTDTRGVVRYTPDPSRIPSDRRDTMKLVEPGMEVPPGTTPEGAAVLYAPPDEVPFDQDPWNAPSQARQLESSTTPAPPPTPPPFTGSPEVRELMRRRQELEAQIARDEETLKQLISQADGVTPLEESPELQAIAHRLPALQRELRALDERRARLELH